MVVFTKVWENISTTHILVIQDWAQVGPLQGDDEDIILLSIR